MLLEDWFFLCKSKWGASPFNVFVFLLLIIVISYVAAIIAAPIGYAHNLKCFTICNHVGKSQQF